MNDELPADWHVAKLGDVCTKVGSGATPRGGEEVYIDNGTALIRSQNVYNDGFHYDGLAHVGHDHAGELENVTVEAGDVLLNITGDSVARCCPAPADVLPARVNQHVAIVRPRFDALDRRFLRYFLVGPEMQAHMLALAGAGATRNALTKGMIESFRVPCPPLHEQKAIAQVLGTLDDKIELNRRMNQTLEQVARAIFKSWFADFDPVRAKSEGRKPLALDPATAALFPDSFADSPIGPIPDGWAVVPLGEAFELNPPRTLRRDEAAPYLDMANMPTTSARPLQWIDRPFTSGTKFVNGDVLVARITPCLENGKTAFVDFLDDGQVGWGSTEFIVMRSKPPLPVEYAYCLARTDNFREHAIVNMTGSSGRQRVPVSCFDTFFVCVPTKSVAHRFGEIAGPILRAVKHFDEESRTLAAIRDALLPKLLSGEIRIRDAERIVGRRI